MTLHVKGLFAGTSVILLTNVIPLNLTIKKKHAKGLFAVQRN